MKIFKANNITPKKKRIASWGYTTVEGGKITRFKFPESDTAIERMEKELTNYNNWARYPGPHPEGRGSRKYTYVKIIPGYDCVKVHSLIFPDKRVWDSTLRNFRKIRDYETN